MADLNTRTVLTNGFAQTVFHRALMAYRRHIDKVDNDQTAEVTQTQLTCNFVGRFQVSVKGGLFDITATGCTRGVDIDGGQRFGAIDNDRAAGRQTDFTLEGGFNLRFDLVVAKQRDFTGVELNFAAEIRTAQRGDMLASQLKHFRVIDKDFADVLTQIITESTNDNVTFLVNQERSRAVFSGLLNSFPVFQTEAQIPLQSISRFTHTGGADDQTHAIGQFEAGQRFFQFGTVIAFNTTRNATRARVVWHQYQIAACQANKGSQRSAFVAAFFFINLDDNFLTFAQHIFDVRTAMRVVISREIFAGNFFEGKETVTFSAVINKGSFQARFNSGDFTFVDVRFFLLVSRTFNIQIVQTLPINKGDTQLFLLSCVD